MTPAALAALHARCFTMPPPFSETDFAGLLAMPGCFLVEMPQGFALGRVVLDEAELLTLAVDPDARRRGTGRALLQAFENGARARGAVRAFLEVAAGNHAAIGLYQGAGYAECGRRRAYYRGADGRIDDAMVMAVDLAAG